MRKIFVGGLPHNLSDEEFRVYFAQFGTIDDCAILKDKRTGKPRGFGFVTYHDLPTLDVVMEKKDTHFIQGKWVDCKRAVPAVLIQDDVSEASSIQLDSFTPGNDDSEELKQSHQTPP
jgi:RNA recognition motif-containing protein